MPVVPRHATRLERPEADAAFAHLPVAAMIWSPERTCLEANPLARALFRPLDLVGLGLNAVFAHWPSPPAAAPTVEPAVLLNGSGRHFAVSVAPLPAGGHVMTLTDVTTALQAEAVGARDALTGLHQRAGFGHRLAQAIAAAAQDGGRLAVLSVDLDRFKSVNDGLGHAIGDALLVKVADRLRNLAGPGGTVARLGGDHFGLLLAGPAASTEAACGLATRLIDIVARSYAVQGHMLNIGASVGLAAFPADAADAEGLLRRADLALYRAKAEGRGAVRVFEPGMDVRIQARRNLEADLRQALARRQFTLAYQPLIDLATQEVAGFEALLRWHHPVRGPVSPAEFIPLAEELGLITPIGDWVLRTACREAAGWPRPVSVAVNVSPVQFRGGKLAATVADALERGGLAPERLEIEITEGALLDETTLVLHALHAIRALGVGISMDDFGTGYSSLSYLRKFPFNKIKIDQSFVRGLGAGGDCDAIVGAVAKLAASLGMRTTAEGVETEAQLNRIRGEGCTQVQGFLTGRPMTGEDASTLLQTPQRS